MTRLDLEALEAAGARVYGVGELVRELRQRVEAGFASVLVEGEVSNLTRHASGHSYFSVKDDGGHLRCVLFRLEAQRLGFALADGECVVLFGRCTVYDRKGELQLVVAQAFRRGAGRAAEALEALRRLLHAEGLFDAATKRPLPFFTRNLGVVTSPSGAALHDILSVVRRRAPCTQVFVLPVRVQGDGAAAEIADAIDFINARLPIQALIVGRGGGSLEDLRAFDDERVARAVFRSRVPVISAVGHEINVTICDRVADVRAPTPSVAAELAVPDCGAMARAIDETGRRLLAAELRGRARAGQRLEGFLTRYGLRAVRSRIGNASRAGDELGERLRRGIDRRLERATAELRSNAGRLDTLSPLATLGRGYAIVERLPGRALVRSPSELGVGDELRLLFARGGARARVLETFAGDGDGDGGGRS
ncbi:MAG: exodeoxyribonuclease VII large subunit [Gemmatimonadota bacterium]